MAVKTIPLDSQLRELERKLKALADDVEGKKIVSKNGGPLRQALFQAAKVVEEEAEQQAPKDTGRLERAIGKERVRKPEQIPATEAFFVRPRKGKKRDDERGAYYWHFVEFGTRKQAAQPFMRKAFALKSRQALDVFTLTLKRKIILIEKKLSRGVT